MFAVVELIVFALSETNDDVSFSFGVVFAVNVVVTAEVIICVCDC